MARHVTGRVVAVGLSLFACACVTTKAPAKTEISSARADTGYVSGIAAAYYCTCERWPGSWSELHRFDDYLHTQAQEAGEAPMKRFEWEQVDGEVSINTSGSLVIRPANEVGETGTTIAVPLPECSRFDRTRFSAGCGAGAALR